VLTLRQVLVLLACGSLLCAILAQINHLLAPLGFSLSVPGLLIAFAALRLPLRAGLAVACLVGLWLDAAAPLLLGHHFWLLGLAFCALHAVRERLPREETLIGVVAALFLNLGVFVALAFIGLGGLPDPTEAGLRLLADLLFSQIFTALIGPWFLALQLHALRIGGAAPATANRRYA
jgi:hypothetical protein